MSDLARLAADLHRAGATIGAALHPALDKSGEAMEEHWKLVFPWSGSKHLPHIGGLITHDTTAGAMAAETQAYVRKEGQGNLAHLIEYGGPRSGAHPGGGPALAKQAPIFTAEAALIAVALLGGGAGAVIA